MNEPRLDHSPKGLLIDQRLRDRLDGQGLREVIVDLRATDPPHSWKSCARKVTEWSGVRVSYQTVQNLAVELGIHAPREPAA